MDSTDTSTTASTSTDVKKKFQDSYPGTALFVRMILAILRWIGAVIYSCIGTGGILALCAIFFAGWTVWPVIYGVCLRDSFMPSSVAILLELVFLIMLPVGVRLIRQYSPGFVNTQIPSLDKFWRG